MGDIKYHHGKYTCKLHVTLDNNIMASQGFCLHCYQDIYYFLIYSINVHRTINKVRILTYYVQCDNSRNFFFIEDAIAPRSCDVLR
ncbi:hypothetical protein PUN28_007571 [Cardiocondyla obscurior]|uniref:Uncharacterized protein n=1 Tax=Cardiocondyla obscurior TaxID=286306 RepID=A0AAW2G4R6_9HYME